MLFERRCYTLRPGGTASFWQAQVDRGLELVRPIQQRLVGYFSTVSGPVDQVIHLYRYDGFDDWQQRLHGLYAVAGLEPYFRTVRALMTSQKNGFMSRAPVDALTPLWSDAHDWVPDRSAPPRLPGAQPASLVDEHTCVLLPGTQPHFWQAWREAAALPEVLDADSLIGCFVSLVGQQHVVRTYRFHYDLGARDALAARRTRHPAWQALQRQIASLVASEHSMLLRPGPLSHLAPLFYEH